MAWDWVTKGAKKALELGAESLQHSSLIERLVTQPPESARQELERTWTGMDERARAGFKMTLAAAILKQQAVTSPDGKARLARLMALRDVAAPPGAVSKEAAPAGRNTAADAIAALRKELDSYRPQLDSARTATWNALSKRLKSLTASAKTAGSNPGSMDGAIARFREAMVSGLGTASAPSTPRIDRVAETRAALDTYVEGPDIDPAKLMTLARAHRDARRSAADWSTEDREQLQRLEQEFTASTSIALVRRREAVQRRVAVEFVNLVCGENVLTLSPPDLDDRTETTYVGLSAMSAMGIGPAMLLHTMVDAALRNEREAGTLTADRQRAFAKLAVKIQDVELKGDAADTDDRCWEITGELLTLTEAAAGSGEATAVPDVDDETAKRLARLETYRDELTQALASGKMSAARAAAYRAQLAEAEAVTRLPRTTEVEETVFRSRLRELLDRQLESLETVGAPTERPATSRAWILHDRAGRLQSLLLQELTRFAVTTGERETVDALAVRINEAQKVLEHLTDEQGAFAIERETLRRVAMDVHRFQRRRHLTLITPPWPSPEVRTEASGIFYAGAADLLSLAKAIADERRLKILAAGRSGKDPVQDAWNRLRSAAIGVFDLRDHAPIEDHRDLQRASRVAAVSYELGMAYCLGLPSVIVSRSDQQLPFDLDVTPVSLDGTALDRATLGEALDEALYGGQRANTGSALEATWEYFLRQWATVRDDKTRASVEEMKKEAVADPILSARLLEYATTQMAGTPPQVVLPILPGCYPDTSARRCFVVMPFRDRLEAGFEMVANECRKAGITVVRGDTAAEQQILRSIWDEIGRASFVTADLTDFNPNVCLELGIADTLGRATFLIGQSGVEKHLFAAIAKRRVHLYGTEAADRRTREALRQFFGVPQAPPPAPEPPPVQSIAGLWSGTLSNGTETMESTLRIAPSGRPVWGYRDSSGYEEAELTRPGQQIQYVPPGGGVVTVRVKQVSGSAQTSSYLVAWSFEKAAYGVMDQQYSQIALQCELRGDKLSVVYAETGETYVSDLELMLGGNNTRQFRGLLERQQDS